MMKITNTITQLMQNKYWLSVLNIFLIVLMSSCSSSSDNTTPFVPQNTLDGKVIVLGAQVDEVSGDLVMYVTGTNLDGTPLTSEQLNGAAVRVGNTSYTDVDEADELSIARVTGGEMILSLSLVTDYSNSTNGELEPVASIFSQVLDMLPPVFEAQVMTFSDTYEIQQDWTDNLALLKTAVGKAHSDRNKTALYDSIGVALKGDVSVDGSIGLTDQCHVAHLMVLFTDGDDNMSNTYTSPEDLASIVNEDKTIVIVLATSEHVRSVLKTLKGDYGAVVQVSGASGLQAELENWIASLDNIVKITLNSNAVTGESVRINIGSQTAEVDPNIHCSQY